jgi:hypothetical protein
MAFVHHGPWSPRSRQHRTLRFLESFITAVDSLSVSHIPAATFFSPLAIFHDNNKTSPHLGGASIWERTQRILVPFSHVYHEVVEVRVVPSPDGRDVVYGEFLTHFRLRGDSGGEDIVAPRFFVWTVGEAVDGKGTEGLQIAETRLFWDTGILGRYVTQRNRRASAG